MEVWEKKSYYQVWVLAVQFSTTVTTVKKGFQTQGKLSLYEVLQRNSFTMDVES